MPIPFSETYKPPATWLLTVSPSGFHTTGIDWTVLVTCSSAEEAFHLNSWEMSGVQVTRCATSPIDTAEPLATLMAMTSWAHWLSSPSRTSSSTSPTCSLAAPLSNTKSFPSCIVTETQRDDSVCQPGIARNRFYFVLRRVSVLLLG